MTLVKHKTPKGHYYKLDGRRVSGVTTLINSGLPKPQLIDWAARTVAEYVADNPGDIASLREAGRDELVAFLKVRHNAIRDAAGARGTEIHDYAQQFLDGADDLEVPAELLGYVEACVAFMDDWRVQPVLVETPVAHRVWQYCGTLDLVADVYDGTRRIIDWKSARSGIWGETGLQLAGYANAEFYLDADGNEQPMAGLNITNGLAVWLRPDGYDAYETRTDADAFKKFQHVTAVARLAKTLKADLIGPALPHPVHALEPAA